MPWRPEVISEPTCGYLPGTLKLVSADPPPWTVAWRVLERQHETRAMAIQSAYQMSSPLPIPVGCGQSRCTMMEPGSVHRTIRSLPACEASRRRRTARCFILCMKGASYSTAAHIYMDCLLKRRQGCKYRRHARQIEIILGFTRKLIYGNLCIYIVDQL